MKVELTYFKRTGKFYCGAEYESDQDTYHGVIAEVRHMAAIGKLPGLIEGHHDFIIFVLPRQDGWQLPHLVFCSEPENVEDEDEAGRLLAEAMKKVLRGSLPRNDSFWLRKAKEIRRLLG